MKAQQIVEILLEEDKDAEYWDRMLRRMRQRIFDYPPEKEEKAMRVLHKIKDKKIAKQSPSPQADYHWMYAAE